MRIADRMCWALARQCRAGDVSIVGVATPLATAAMLLARRFIASDMTVLIGTIVDPDDFDVARSLTDADVPGSLSAGSLSQPDMLDLLGRGGVTLQFVSPVQVDAHGNINASRVRTGDGWRFFPGSLALPDTAALVERLVAYRAGHSSRFLVPEVDFVSGAGRAVRDGRPVATPGRGVTHVVTEAAVIEIGEPARLIERNQGHTPAAIRDGCGFDLVGDGEPAPEMPEEVREYLGAAIDPFGARALEIPDLRAAATARLAAR